MVLQFYICCLCASIRLAFNPQCYVRSPTQAKEGPLCHFHFKAPARFEWGCESGIKFIITLRISKPHSDTFRISSNPAGSCVTFTNQSDCIFQMFCSNVCSHLVSRYCCGTSANQVLSGISQLKFSRCVLSLETKTKRELMPLYPMNPSLR